MKHVTALIYLVLISFSIQAKPELSLNDQDIFSMPGLEVTVFADVYPDGHQTGVTVIQHGRRMAANGDVRLEASPGQWSPVPRSNARKIDRDRQTITQLLAYPDPTKNRKGFNPIEYPDLRFSYEIVVRPVKDSSFEISVNLKKPLPKEWIGKVGFNFELMPVEYFGSSYAIGEEFGIFQRQPNGPMIKNRGDTLSQILGQGKSLHIAAEDPIKKMSIVSMNEPLVLLDGRSNHNNGWFIVRSIIPEGATDSAIKWLVTPNVEADWRYEPVTQLSQVGYRPKHPKKIILEQDKRDSQFSPVTIYEINEQGKKPVFKANPKPWGEFLRYQYGILDFTYLDKPGMFVAEYRGRYTNPFQISETVYQRHVWQPTLEYFLPVQMCHMRVEQKYRVWHDLCHQDDALMAPTDHIHFDGYYSGVSTLTNFEPQDRIPLLSRGGWHDAGDYDLRIESQSNTIWLLSAMIEEFHLSLDSTTIDQSTRKVLIHQPDGQSDALQQVEHGLLSVLGGYQALGRLYRGIISPTQEQYVLLGDASAQTDGLAFDATLESNQVKDGKSGRFDDRWVFTENHPDRALNAAGAIAAAARVLKKSNPKMALLAQKTATDIAISNMASANSSGAKVFAFVELFKTTQDRSYLKNIEAMEDEIIANIGETGWHLARIKAALRSSPLLEKVNQAVAQQQERIRQQANQSPYGVPYTPKIWGAGWGIAELGVKQYYLHKGWPEHASSDIMLNALNFILGVHPGENTVSFASGVGANSALVAYGVNRADWSHIPGGVISGTALIRPDLPELKTWPYLWQQTEYVVGGGATNFMFLVLAADRLE